jgi:hypothetical protein
LRAIVAAAALLLAACAGGPPIPEWRGDAQGGLRSFESAYLAGRSRIAEQEFVRARSALASTGRADLVARAELVRCAARVASLDFDDCPEFRKLSVDASPAERAYAAFLAGETRPGDAALLPEHHRALAAGGDSGLAAIEDPLSRLVAAGVLFRQGRMSPPGISLAVETASANGWRRPLLAWLGVQEKRAREAGDADGAAAIRRRIRLASGEEGGS